MPSRSPVGLTGTNRLAPPPGIEVTRTPGQQGTHATELGFSDLITLRSLGGSRVESEFPGRSEQPLQLR